jgi:hypothetical protein
MTYFLNPHFSFFLCDKYNVIISKLHYEFIFFCNSPITFMMIFIKLYNNMDDWKINNVNVEYNVYILNSFIIQKTYNCDSSKYPLNSVVTLMKCTNSNFINY